jgi:uncharacterized membrane protein
MRDFASVGQAHQTQLWIAPVVGAVLAGLAAAGALLLDQRIDWETVPLPLFAGHPDTARTLLSVIASSVTTLLALIFTIIVVAIQLATSQYSPRTISTLLQDRPSHFTIGVFVGTFTYTVVLLVALQLTVEEGELVSGLSVTLAFVLAVISLGTFAVYSNHIIHSVRVTSVINRIAGLTRSELERMYPGSVDDGSTGDGRARAAVERLQREHEPTRVIEAPVPAVLVAVDSDRLLQLACRSDSTLVLVPHLGTFLPQGHPLIRVYGGDPGEILDHFEFSPERSLRSDVSYGLRQLTDMAIRALSIGINDPATAVQVVDQLHDLLRRLVRRGLDTGSRFDEHGEPRVLIASPDWNDFLHLTVEELRLYAAGSLQVTRRLRALLEDLERIAPPLRREAVIKQLELLGEASDREMPDRSARELARQADLRGTGL